LFGTKYEVLKTIRCNDGCDGVVCKDHPYVPIKDDNNNGVIDSEEDKQEEISEVIEEDDCSDYTNCYVSPNPEDGYGPNYEFSGGKAYENNCERVCTLWYVHTCEPDSGGVKRCGVEYSLSHCHYPTDEDTTTICRYDQYELGTCSGGSCQPN